MRLFALLVLMLMSTPCHSASISALQRRFSAEWHAVPCPSCLLVADEVLKAVPRGENETIVAVTLLCELLKKEDDSVCHGVVQEFGTELFNVIKGGVAIATQDICYALSFCPEPPGDNWNVTFPKPKPPVRPVTYPSPSSDGYEVLHLTDIHVDWEYAVGSSTICGEPVCCRANSPKLAGTTAARSWGEYACDLAPSMLQKVLEFLASGSNVTAKILIWTGDSPPHFLWEQTKAAVKNDTLQVTAEIENLLSKLIVVPSIGNHESFPVNNFAPPSLKLQSWLYSALAKSWAPWIPANQLELFGQKGYFATTLPPAISGGKSLKIVSLQTNYCNNLAFWLYLNDTDPGEQLEWLIDELQASEDANQPVWLSGHIPPSSTSCRGKWSDRFVQIVNRYEATVVGQFYGHTHHDSFAVNRVGTRASGVQYVAPSVTTFSFINPSWRFYKVSAAEHLVIDHETWHMDLHETYAQNASSPVVKRYYQASTAYTMTDLSPASWLALANSFETDDVLFQTYHRHYSTGYYDAGACTGLCRSQALCRVFSATSTNFTACLKAAHATPTFTLC